MTNERHIDGMKSMNKLIIFVIHASIINWNILCDFLFNAYDYYILYHKL